MQESIASTAHRSAHRTRLSICYLPLAQLKPDPRNARVHVRVIIEGGHDFHPRRSPVFIEGGHPFS